MGKDTKLPKGVRIITVDDETVYVCEHVARSECIEEYCPLCGKRNVYTIGRHSFSAIKCWSCGQIYMEDDEVLLDIVEHEGLEYEDGKRGED